MNKNIIFNIIGAAVVLGVVFLSQKAFFAGKGQTFYNKTSSDGESYATKVFDWFGASIGNLYPKVGEELEKRADLLKDEIDSGKEKITSSAAEKIENYFGGIKDAVMGKNNSQQNCSCQQHSAD